MKTTNKETPMPIGSGDIIAENKDAFSDKNEKIICKHCGKTILKTRLVGLSLICPYCKKPQNGHHHPNL